MMVKNILSGLGIIALLVGVVMGTLWYTGYFDKPANPPPTEAPRQASIPTVDITAVAQYTVTPGPQGQGQLPTVVALAKPTPRTQWTIPDFESFLRALRTKATHTQVNLNLYAKYEGFGGGIYCANLKDWRPDLNPAYVAMGSAVYAEWFAGIQERDFQNPQIEVADGDTVPVYVNRDGNEVIEMRKNAIVTVTLPWGIIGPVVRDENQSTLNVKDIGSGWRLLLLPREWLTKENVPAEMRDYAGNKALSLAKWDSLLHFWIYGGTVDTSAIEQLRANLLLNISTPSGDPAYKSPYDQLLLAAKEAITEMPQGQQYAGIQELRVKLDDSGLYYLETTLDPQPEPLIPADLSTRYADSLCANYIPNGDDINSLRDSLAR